MFSTVIIVLIAIMGGMITFACYITYKYHQQNEAKQSQIQGQSSQPIYDTPVVFQTTREQELEITKNVAYGPLS